MKRTARVVFLIRTSVLAVAVVAAFATAAFASSGLSPLSQRLQEALFAAHFAEPLVPTADTSAEEDAALVDALQNYARRAEPNNFRNLERFLQTYPQSGWAASIQLNMGLSYLHEGYFSKSLEFFQSAWMNGKSAEEPMAHALVDRAVGELARLNASLGRNEELRQLFVDLQGRAVTGSATEALQAARDELELAQKDPRHLFLCGPLALQSLMISSGVEPKIAEFLQWYRASSDGTNLAELGRLASTAKFKQKTYFRKPGQPLPIPSVVHWKLGHFAAIVGENNGLIHVKDSVLPNRDVWMPPAVVDAEASGYFLVPDKGADRADLRLVDASEGKSVWGKGPTSATPPGLAGPQDPAANGPPNPKTPDPPTSPPPLPEPPASPPLPGLPPADPPTPAPANADAPPETNCGMCGYNIGEATVSVSLSDTPVGYMPAIGPSAKVQLRYNQRDDSQPAVFGFFNVSPKWTINWLSYVTDDPTNIGANVSRYIAGGGAYYYSGYRGTSGLFTAQTTDGSILALASQSPITYRRQLADGSVEIYAQSDGATSYPRRVFLSQVVDPQGNALTLNYDTQLRLTSLTDAVGRQTTFSYDVAAHPLLVTKITDPFGRKAVLTYDASVRLSSITDVIGLTSSFGYDANSLVNQLTTPYGTTTFSYTAPGTSGPPRYAEVTDPMGFHEREEWLEPAPNSDSDPPATIPSGMPLQPVNQWLSYRDSFHWDKEQYTAAGCSPSGGCDYSKARNTHFLHTPINDKSGTIESVKNPLENRVWYNYPGQTSAIHVGSFESPSAIGRVLDDGTTQLSTYAYDTSGYFKLTQHVDPVGRRTTYAYANQVDLAAVSQTTAFGVPATLAQYIYDTKHRPILATDAAGQLWRYAYNGAGQMTSATNPLGQTTTYTYDTSHRLVSIVDANSVTAASFTYDAFDRVRTTTDSEGWTVTYDYDDLDRVTKLTYLDGTSDTYSYDRLDLASYESREHRIWSYVYDANRRLVSVTDPAGQDTLYDYSKMGDLASLTDPNNNVTTWTYDIERRVAQKAYADASTVSYTYEDTTSRLRAVLDALGQTKQYDYAPDNQLAAVSYLSAVNPTPDVGFTYDPYFPRPVTMTDGNGTTSYAYYPAGEDGALRLHTENWPSLPNAIVYSYDAIGRVASRLIDGSGPESFSYDAIGRVVSHVSDLGEFGITYLGETSQITDRALSGSTLATTWSYLDNLGDRRLAEISNVGLSASQYSTFQYVTTPENFITSVTETSDTANAYPTTLTQTASFNDLNQLTDLSGQAFAYDANGNLLSDGVRAYDWDAENRLIRIDYPGAPDKQTAYAYDGLSRRTAMTSTPPGGGTSAITSYLWCGNAICQARDASNLPVKQYLAEGEIIFDTLMSPLYYGVDQIGSVRRVFTSSVATSYDYEPFGLRLQFAAPITQFPFAGLFDDGDSGLNMTHYRAYDPNTGRWLSRDPIGETANLNSNLYTYADQNPITKRDTTGLFSHPNNPNPCAPAGPHSPDLTPADESGYKEYCFYLQCLLALEDGTTKWKPKQPPPPPPIIIQEPIVAPIKPKK